MLKKHDVETFPIFVPPLHIRDHQFVIYKPILS